MIEITTNNSISVNPHRERTGRYLMANPLIKGMKQKPNEKEEQSGTDSAPTTLPKRLRNRAAGETSAQAGRSVERRRDVESGETAARADEKSGAGHPLL